MHLTIGAFGNTDFVKKLAKAGTINDIAIHNHASSEGVFTYVNSASDKVQPLLQAIGMSDIPVLWLSQLTQETGEQIVALDAASFQQGLIVDDGVGEEQIRRIIKGTSLESFPILSNDLNELRQKLFSLDISRGTESPVWIPVDNYFSVKGVGVVVLAHVSRGRIKKYGTLRIEPPGKEILIKGIQSQDKDISEAEAGMRVGLNIKGVEADELKRGYVICTGAKTGKEIAVSFTKSRYSKEPVEKGGQLFISVGLQVVPATVADARQNILMLKLEHPVAYYAGQKCIFASTKQTMPRILGSGVIE